MSLQQTLASQPVVLRLARSIAGRCLLPAVMVAGMLLAPAAHANTLEIQFTGLDLVYDGTDIYDATSILGGSGNPAQSDALTSMDFFVDGNLVGSQATDLFADVYIKNVLNVPATGGFVNSLGNGGAFGIDLLTKNQTPGWGIALNIDSMQFFYTGSQISITLGGVASSLVAQDLPFGLQFDSAQPITIVLSSANLTNVTTGGGFLTGFNSAGTGNIAGTDFNNIPEPSTMILAAVGAVVLGFCDWRRKRR